jgi:hypothetical protein
MPTPLGMKLIEYRKMGFQPQFTSAASGNESDAPAVVNFSGRQCRALTV